MYEWYNSIIKVPSLTAGCDGIWAEEKRIGSVPTSKEGFHGGGMGKDHGQR